jgi:DNA protecting protein DprA
LNILVPHSGHFPSVAGRPFFIVICVASFISRLVLHLTQYAVGVAIWKIPSSSVAAACPARRLGQARDNPAVHSQTAVRLLAADTPRRDSVPRGEIEDTMELTRPRFTSSVDLFASRPHRAARTRFSGLWASGRLDGLDRKTVAVVGSRAPSEGGLGRSRALGEALARAGVCVVSGLALGIDAAAHEGSLAGGGATVGILGGGHRRFFPRRNRDLAERIVASGGAVLSPFAPDEAARPWQFLERNAIVAALADAVVVVEAAERSGALSTANWAAQFGIDVLAYPADVDRPKSAGCNALIRDGATLVRGPDDVLEAIGFAPEDARASRSRADVALGRPPLERRILAQLSAGPTHFDALVLAANAPIADVSAALVMLEIGGAIRRENASATYSLA